MWSVGCASRALKFVRSTIQRYCPSLVRHISVLLVYKCPLLASLPPLGPHCLYPSNSHRGFLPVFFSAGRFLSWGTSTVQLTLHESLHLGRRRGVCADDKKKPHLKRGFFSAALELKKGIWCLLVCFLDLVSRSCNPFDRARRLKCSKNRDGDGRRTRIVCLINYLLSSALLEKRSSTPLFLCSWAQRRSFTSLQCFDSKRTGAWRRSSDARRLVRGFKPLLGLVFQISLKSLQRLDISSPCNFCSYHP